jgi:hypothetical protein
VVFIFHFIFLRSGLWLEAICSVQVFDATARTSGKALKDNALYTISALYTKANFVPEVLLKAL